MVLSNTQPQSGGTPTNLVTETKNAETSRATTQAGSLTETGGAKTTASSARSTSTTRTSGEPTTRTKESEGGDGGEEPMTLAPVPLPTIDFGVMALLAGFVGFVIMVTRRATA